jgi:glycosyltransferase involved in cell wall biosynthesis
VTAGARRRIHLVYPHREFIPAPDAIGRELGRRLEQDFEVHYYDWFELGMITPQPGDILIGHPHPDPRSIFRRSLDQPGWRRKIMLAPFNHRDLRQVAFEDSILDKCDVLLAITGPYWYRTLPESRCSHWAPKLIPIEHAVDASHYSPLERQFAEPGRRRLVYIGHSGRGKGADYLAKIATLLPQTEFGWLGRGKPIPGVKGYGYQDFSSAAGRELLSQFDFVIMAGNSDSNPTTIMEAMSWGLVPICTPTCGFENMPGIINIPVEDPDGAAEVIEKLLSAPNSDLISIRKQNWIRIRDFYNWDRFAADVRKVIESDASPPLLTKSFRRHLTMRYYDWTSPYGRLRWSLPGRIVMRIFTR